MNIPSYTILNDELGDQIDPQSTQPAWQKMYSAGVSSPPPDTSILGHEMLQMDDTNYESLTHQMQTPSVPSSYGEAIFNNSGVSKKNLRFNLPATPPDSLPSYLNVPYLTPPYGTPYPSSKYSAYDGVQTMNAGIPQYYASPGVPASSYPALQDARDSPSVPMGPDRIAIIAENNFKEGFMRGREQYASTHDLGCSECIAHIQGCPICDGYMNGDRKFFKIAIGVLIVLVLILLWMLFRRLPPTTFKTGVTPPGPLFNKLA